MKKVSETQRAILKFLAAGHAPFLAYYDGPPGAEGGRQAGFFWRQYDRTKAVPKVPANSVNGLVLRGLLESAGYGDFKITQSGREAVFAI